MKTILPIILALLAGVCQAANLYPIQLNGQVLTDYAVPPPVYWTDYTNLQFYADFATTNTTDYVTALGLTNYNFRRIPDPASGPIQTAQGSSYAVNINNSTMYLQGYNNSGVNATTAMTVCGWVYIRSMVGNSFYYLVGSNVSASAGFGADKLNSIDRNSVGFGNAYSASTDPATKNAWIFQVGTWNKSLSSGYPLIYTNNVLVTSYHAIRSALTTAQPSTYNAPWTINKYGINYTMDGLVGDVIVYTNRSLTASEITNVWLQFKGKYGY